MKELKRLLFWTNVRDLIIYFSLLGIATYLCFEDIEIVVTARTLIALLSLLLVIAIFRIIILERDKRRLIDELKEKQ